MDKGFKLRCNYCVKQFSRANLKACGRCRMVRYCSKECQKQAWTTHKNCCSPAMRDSLAQNADQAALNSMFNKWLNHWHDSLHSWSIWAMNLSNHPRDRLSTYCFVIEIEKRPNAPSPAQYFRMVGGEVMPRDEVLKTLLQLQVPTDNWKDDHRGDDTVQIIIIAEGFIRMKWFSIRDAERRRTNDTGKERDDMGDMLAEDWDVKLMDIIESGDASRTHEHLRLTAMKATLPQFMQGVLS